MATDTHADTAPDLHPPARGRRMRRAALGLGLGAVAVAVVVAVAVPASVFDPSGLSGDVLAEFTAADPVSVGDDAGSVVRESRLEMSPDSWMGWHSHDGNELIAVASGRVVSYRVEDGQCVSHEYGVGQGFVGLPDHIHNLYNPGPEPAVLYVTSVTPEGGHADRDQPRPAACPVGGS